MVIAEIASFTMAGWLGCYLLARNSPLLRSAALGLLAYALVLALNLLESHAPDARSQEIFAGMQLPFLLLPVIFWGGTLWQIRQTASLPRTAGLILVSTLFFGLGFGLILLPFDWLPYNLLLIGIGFDLALFAYAVAVLDAFEQGEAFLPDFVRSLEATLIAVLIFGGQVALAMWAATGLTFPMLVLCLTTISAAIVWQTFADPIQKGLDRIAFARQPRLREARDDLRTVTSALPRMNVALDFESLDEAEFVRLTRRALSQISNLPKLAANPLTNLPVIEARLSQKGGADNTLERAAELKNLLVESIVRLKPAGEGEFGTSDAWRYYNALYFPYVVGLKPNSRRMVNDELDPVAQAALDWFSANVPERTLHNWQNTAAKLVALDLKERGN